MVTTLISVDPASFESHREATHQRFEIENNFNSVMDHLSTTADLQARKR